MTSNKVRLLIVFIITLIFGAVCFPITFPLKFSIGQFNIDRVVKTPDFVFGLDLSGGSRLVFEVDLGKIADDQKDTAVESAKSVVERRVNLFGISEPNVQTSSFEGKRRIIVELSGVKDTDEAVALIGKTAQLVFAEVDTKAATTSAILNPTSLNGGNLKKAQVVFDSNTGSPGVGIEFDAEGTKEFEALTEKNVGKPLAIMLDNLIVSAPIVQGKISGGSAQITGDFTSETAKNLAIQLNSGALPAPLTLVEEKTVEASLGKDSVEKSIRAGLIGIAMVAVFMVVSYGGLGLVAVVALAVFTVISLGIYKLIPVTLTLPGIAGFMLSVGMAVDSNILIFERFKEERKQRSIRDALEISFGRAWDSIRDANIATLFTAFILANPLDWEFLHTSGPVRGFAITLALGIAVSLFTGVFVSRVLLRSFVKK